LITLIPKWESLKNKSGESGKFSSPKMTVNLPAFTSNPPRIHHQKTTFCTPFLTKPPAKTPVNQRQKKTTAKAFI
jgi:hypothetical protein